VAMAADKALSGRIEVALAAAATGNAIAVPLVVGGTVDDPNVTLSRGALIGAAIGTAVMPGVGTGAGAKLGDRLGRGLHDLFGK
jgi:phage-related tail protein